MLDNAETVRYIKTNKSNIPNKSTPRSKMQDTVLSTQEVATLMNVTETTIRRWADQGQPACIRTPGGHRKFLLNDVIRFAEANGYPTRGLADPPLAGDQMERLQLAVLTQDHDKVAVVLLEEALQGDREGMSLLLGYLYKNRVPFPIVVDEIVRPAFTRLGDLWAEGELEVNQEHRASHALTEALIRFAPQMRRKPLNGLSAVCACPEGELHEIGLQSLAYALESEGWSVHYIGSNALLERCAEFVRAGYPAVVCVSMTVTHRKRSVVAELRELSELVHRHQVKLLLGGLFSAGHTPDEFGCDHISGTVRDAVTWLRDVFQLKPGPKREGAVKEATE
jgi:excisionase family DNA binding protein